MVDWIQENAIWGVTWTLIVLGIVGTLLPLIPGQVLILVAGVAHWWVKREDSHLEWWSLVILAILLLISQGLDYLSGAVGNRYFGGSKWGILGTLLGGLIGLFFAPWGFLIGPLAGAFVFEFLFAKKELSDATRSGMGSAVGTMMGIGVKMGMAFVMAGYLIVDLFWF